MPLPKPDFVLLQLQMLRQFDQEAMDGLLHGMSSFVAAEHKRLAEHSKELLEGPPPEGVDPGFLETFHEDDHYFLEEAKKLSEELAIVALYKKIEITSKRLIKTAFPHANERDLFVIRKLKELLSGEGIDVEAFGNYAAMDEARCLNNSIKHNGYVNDELAQYPGWVQGGALSNLGGAYYRLAPLCGSYIDELADALIQKIKSS